MKIKKISLFKSVNVFMAIFCFGAMLYNYCGVNVLTQNKAKSDFNGSSYGYEIQDDLFSISKNGELVGNLQANRKLKFRKSNLPNLTCNAGAIAGAATIAGVTATVAGAGAAVKVGTLAGNAILAGKITGGIAGIVKFTAIGVAAASPAGIFIGAFALT